MVMSVLVDDEGRVCVAHNMTYEGLPVRMTYDPETKIMTLVYDNGGKAQIVSGTLPEIGDRLRKARSILLKQINQGGPAAELEVPLQVLFGEDGADSQAVSPDI